MMLYDALTLDYGFMISRNLTNVDFRARNFEQPKILRGTVDVWWLLDSGGLELMVPHTMSLHNFWKSRTRDGHCPVRLLLISAENISATHRNSQDMDDFERLGADNIK